MKLKIAQIREIAFGDLVLHPNDQGFDRYFIN